MVLINEALLHCCAVMPAQQHAGEGINVGCCGKEGAKVCVAFFSIQGGITEDLYCLIAQALYERRRTINIVNGSILRGRGTGDKQEGYK